MQQSILRIKHRIPLDLIHVTDLPPIVQPNLVGYVGHSGPMTPSLVGAAVLAATSSNNSYSHNINNNTASNMNPHEEPSATGLSASGKILPCPFICFLLSDNEDVILIFYFQIFSE